MAAGLVTYHAKSKWKPCHVCGAPTVKRPWRQGDETCCESREMQNDAMQIPSISVNDLQIDRLNSQSGHIATLRISPRHPTWKQQPWQEWQEWQWTSMNWARSAHAIDSVRGPNASEAWCDSLVSLLPVQRRCATVELVQLGQNQSCRYMSLHVKVKCPGDLQHPILQRAVGTVRGTYCDNDILTKGAEPGVLVARSQG